MPRPPDAAIVSDGPVRQRAPEGTHAWAETLCGVACSRCGVRWSTDLAGGVCSDPYADTAPIDVRIDSDTGPRVVERRG